MEPKQNGKQPNADNSKKKSAAGKEKGVNEVEDPIDDQLSVSKGKAVQSIKQPHEVSKGTPADPASDSREGDNSSVTGSQKDDGASSVQSDGDSAELDLFLQELPSSVSDFIIDNLPQSAQLDVAKVLVSRNITTVAMLGLLDDSSCKELAPLLSDRANLIFLKAVGRNCSSARPLKRRLEEGGGGSDLPSDSVGNLQAKFKAKFGMAIPGRYTVDTQVLSKIKKDELVQLTECDEPGPLSAKRSRIVIDPNMKSFNTEDIRLPRASVNCEAAHVALCLTRFCLSAAMLGKMSPTQALVYLARLFELGERTSVHAIKSADLGMRLEAVRGGNSDVNVSLGHKLACGQADILAACQAESRSSTPYSGSNAQSHRARNRPQVDEPCRQFARGRCRFGANCIYRHDKSQPRQGEDGKEGSPKQQVDQNLSSTEQLDPPKHAPKRVTIPNPGGKSVATPWTRSSLDTIVLQSKVGLHKTGVGRCEDYISSYLTAATACLELDSEQEFSDFRNGGICILPGEEPPLTNQQASFGQRLGELLLNEGAAAGLTALIEKIKGKPTKEQANSVENFALAAASGARRSLAVELGPSIVEREAGNSIYCSLLGTIADRLQLKDIEFPIICQRGLPLGIDVAIPYTNLYPRFKPKKQEEFETPEIHTNYKSMMLPEVREKADKIVRDEEDKGYIQRLGETDLHNEARTFIRRAAVPKAGSFENGVRIVEDFKRSNTNLHSTIPNTARLPSVSHLRQLISSLADATSQSTAKYRILQFDLKSAYRHLGIHPSERKNVSFTHTFLDGNTVAYENKVLSFGHSGAAYWFVRYANLALSCLELILRATFSVSISKPFGSYMYVDDGFLCIWVEIYAQVATVIIVFWLLLGSGLSCDKLRFNLTEGTVVGIRIDIRDSPCFEIDPAKTEKLLADLRALVSSECISEQKLASLAGKLNRYASLRKYLKPYLQPFYGLLAVMRKLGRPAAACPRKSEVNITASFFIDILSDPHAFHSVGPIQRSLDGYAGTMLLFTDASTRALGG
ncbi:hypothetical protein FOL47_001231, partial [Perkinsus chesapeaki]